MSQKAWENKIVGHEMVAPDQLLAHPQNWRLHPRHQQEHLDKAIDKIGFIESVCVSKRSGRVLNGHLRVTLAMRRGVDISVEYVDLTEKEELIALASIDSIGALAQSDFENVETLIKEIEDEDITELLSSINARGPVFKEYDESIADEVQYIECPECGHKFPK